MTEHSGRKKAAAAVNIQWSDLPQEKRIVTGNT
jgi:hypothetical protein